MRKTIGAVGLAVLVAMLAVGCNRERPKQEVSKSSAFTALVSRETVGGLTREQRIGKELYDRYCAVCHGKTGAGDGFNAFNLSDSFGVVLPDLAKIGDEWDAEKTRRIIEGGGPAVGKSKYMPPWGGTLDAGEIRALISYLRVLMDRPTDSSPESGDAGGTG